MTDLSGGRRFWLGGELLSVEWSWSDETPWDYQNWEPGQPSGGEDCIEMLPPQWKWNDRGCNNIGHTLGYVCKSLQIVSSATTTVTTPPTTTATTTATVTCPVGWSQFGGECYKYFENSVKWDDAREHCLSEEVVICLD